MGLLTAQEMRSCGVISSGPGHGHQLQPDNPVIGVRAATAIRRSVAEYGSQMVRGRAGRRRLLLAQAFPGHDTAVDSHLGLRPGIDRSFDELMQRELKPFIAGIEAGAPAVMTTHIPLLPQIEPEHIPATMSRRIMTGLLRKSFGFMASSFPTAWRWTPSKSSTARSTALAAMKAGVDLVFVSRHPPWPPKQCKVCRRAAENGELDLAELDVSVQRLLEAMLAQCAPCSPKTLGDEAACRARAEEVRAASITAVHLPQGGMPALGDNPLVLGCADYRSTIASNAESSGFTFP